MTLDAGIAIDFASVVTDWSDSIDVMTTTIVTNGTTGVESLSLATLTTVVGVWQPANEQRYTQEAYGLVGRPKYLALVPLTPTVSIGDVMAHGNEQGRSIEVKQRPGHQEVLLKELD